MKIIINNLQKIRKLSFKKEAESKKEEEMKGLRQKFRCEGSFKDIALHNWTISLRMLHTAKSRGNSSVTQQPVKLEGQEQRKKTHPRTLDQGMEVPIIKAYLGFTEYSVDVNLEVLQ